MVYVVSFCKNKDSIGNIFSRQFHERFELVYYVIITYAILVIFGK